MNKEIDSVLKLDRNKQYEYFVKKVVDFEEIWSLRDDEGRASLGDNENEFLPLWSKKEFADRCISEEWSSYYADYIFLKQLKSGRRAAT